MKARKSDLRDALDRDFDKYPDSPLRAAVAERDIAEKVLKFEEADRTALKKQKPYLLGREARLVMAGAEDSRGLDRSAWALAAGLGGDCRRDSPSPLGDPSWI